LGNAGQHAVQRNGVAGCGKTANVAPHKSRHRFELTRPSNGPSFKLAVPP
jgi:hypothetical protein